VELVAVAMARGQIAYPPLTATNYTSPGDYGGSRVWEIMEPTVRTSKLGPTSAEAMKDKKAQVHYLTIY